MSWSARWKLNNMGYTLKEVKSNNINTPEAKEQHKAALDAAASVLISNSVGGIDKSYIINLSGHANPNHEPVPCRSNDYVTITIYQEDK